MPIPQPTLTGVIDGLIAAVAADVTLGAGGVIPPVLSAYGVALPLDLADGAVDEGEYSHLRFGGRRTIPDGLSLYFFPSGDRQRYLTSPNGVEGEYEVTIQSYWKDDRASGLILTRTPGKLQRMLCDFTFALRTVLGPAGLGAAGGGWDPAGGTDYVLKPFVAVSRPAAFAITQRENQMELQYFSEIVWTCAIYYTDP